MDRKEELLKACSDMEENRLALISSLIDEVLFLEEQLTYLKTLPFIRINPKDPALQKQTEAARQYTKLVGPYMQGIKLLSSALNKNAFEDDESPINLWFKKANEVLNA